MIINFKLYLQINFQAATLEAVSSLRDEISELNRETSALKMEISTLRDDISFQRAPMVLNFY
jgi:cell division protein FtsB